VRKLLIKYIIVIVVHFVGYLYIMDVFMCRSSVCGVERGVCRNLVGKPEGKRPLGSPRFRWEGNTKMDLQEVGCGVWTRLSWLRIGTGGEHL
jgi:hypothetical protein